MTKQQYPNGALHERLVETHDRLVVVEVAMRDRVDPQLVKLHAEINSLMQLMEKGFNNPAYIKQRIIEFEKGLADHEIRISGLEAGFVVLESETARAHVRINDVEKVVGEDRQVTRTTVRRVDALEYEVFKSFPLYGGVLALITGIIAGWLWARHDFGSTFTVGTTSGTTQSAADMAICAWLFGAGVGFAIMALAVLLNRTFSESYSDSANTTVRQDGGGSNPTINSDIVPKTEILPTQRVGQTS